MKHSQFWKNLEQVYGSAYGQSLAADLVLEPWYQTAADVLEQGVEPQLVWESLIDATSKPEEFKWLHMAQKKKK
nr:DUF3046 domain-containing protein [Actinomyces sp. UMB0138]